MSTSAGAAATAATPLSAAKRFSTFLHAAAFVAGFTTIFVLLFGLPTYAVGQVLGDYKPVLALLGGVLVIVFGLITLDVIKAGWFNYDTRVQWAGRSDWGFVSSYLMGVFFAAGWSPCIGATLGAILTMGYNQSTVGQGLLLLFAYSLGLGIPFLLVGLGIDRAARALRRVQRYMPAVKLVTGILLIGVGLLVLNDALPMVLRLAGVPVNWPEWLNQISLQRVATAAVNNGWYYDPAGESAVNPTLLLALAAGLLSFLSPCVLPLVPAYVSYLSGRAVQQMNT
jgi:cytochrome c-type biogenesis protein